MLLCYCLFSCQNAKNRKNSSPHDKNWTKCRTKCACLYEILWDEISLKKTESLWVTAKTPTLWLKFYDIINKISTPFLRDFFSSAVFLSFKMLMKYQRISPRKSLCLHHHAFVHCFFFAFTWNTGQNLFFLCTVCIFFCILLSDVPFGILGGVTACIYAHNCAFPSHSYFYIACPPRG